MNVTSVEGTFLNTITAHFLLSYLCQESGTSRLDSVISHLADIILLEDTPSIQMEVAVLVKEFPDIR